MDGKETILITGASGLVGSALSNLLKRNNYEVIHLSRSPKENGFETFLWDIKKMEMDEQAIKKAEIVIHLAGAGVADNKWSESWKKEIYDSRINSTKLLAKNIKQHNPNLKKFISASAIGYYGLDTGLDVMTEESPKGEGFLADVVEDWENEVMEISSIGIPVSMVRIGIVLSKEGGALEKMVTPIKLGVGAPLASGNQYMSWIHMEDLVEIFHFLVKNKLEGKFNGVSSTPVTNKEFTKELAKNLNRPLIFPNVPSFALKMLLGEMAQIVTGGNNVSNKKLTDVGFKFQYPMLSNALKDLLG